MNNKDKNKKLYDFISEVNKTAYRDVFLLANQVLSKNPLTTNILNRYLSGQEPGSHSLIAVIIKLLRYYKYSFKEYGMYIGRFISYALKPLIFSPPSASEELILIDTFILTDKLESSKRYQDTYFPKLEELLIKKGKNYTYLPFFYNLSKKLNLSQVLTRLNESKIPILCEYQLLSALDRIVRIPFFIIVYPWSVLKFGRAISKDTYEGRLLKYELIDTLQHVAFMSFSRYLQGVRICKLPYKSIKVFGYYENQVVHKSLYKGLRIIPGKVKIYGMQPIYSQNLLNIIPDPNEEPYGIIPDKIIANSSELIPEGSRLNFVWLSLRYPRVFSTNIERHNQKNIIILLPYMSGDAKNLLRLVNLSKINLSEVLIKAHPGTPIEDFSSLLPKGASVTNEDTYSLFKRTKILIGASSATLLEAPALGIPVITIRNTNLIDCNPLPDYGKGIIWNEITRPEELKPQINRIERELEDNPKKITDFAHRFKHRIFREPTEERIISTFDL